MPQVKVSQEFKGKKQAVYKAVKDYLDGRETLQKLGASMNWNDKTHSGELEGGSFSGALSVSEKGGSVQVSIVVDLPLLLTPLRGKVEEELKKHLGRVKV